MLTRTVKIQLLIFSLLAAVALTFSALVYADVPSAVGVGKYTVSAKFADISGLYPRALVTYRGVDVGKVDSVDLASRGAVVRMSIDSGIRIPASVQVEIHSTSAIGEQYIDLVPEGSGGPYLAEGAKVAMDQTTQMPQISPVLESLNGLLKSVPQAKTTAVLDEVDTALGGSGDDLGSLIDDTTSVVKQAQGDIDATTSLIRALSPVLDTQNDLAPLTASSLKSLASFTGQLKSSDGDLRSLLKTGPAASDSLDSLITKLRPTVPSLLKNATTTSQVLNAYQENVRHLLIQYPALQSRLQSAVTPHTDEGLVKLDLHTNINNPQPCLKGYIPVTERRDPTVTSLTDTPTAQHCELARSGPENSRGARNIPCPNDPSRRASSPVECGLLFDGTDAGRAVAEAPGAPGSAKSLSQSTVDMMSLLGGASQPPGGLSWRGLLTRALDL